MDKTGQIHVGNALRLDWLKICPSAIRMDQPSTDLFDTQPDQAKIDFEAKEVETYICGNPPYLGFTWQTADQKSDLEGIFTGRTDKWKSLDYVSGWLVKAADYGVRVEATSAFVSTNSICQGEQVPIVWPLIFRTGREISFAHTSFKWSNLASYNAGVTVIVVGLSGNPGTTRRLIYDDADGRIVGRIVQNINAYLISGDNVIVEPRSRCIGPQAKMYWGNKPSDGGHLLLNPRERSMLLSEAPKAAKFVRRFLGSKELIHGLERYCIWIENDARDEAAAIPQVRAHMNAVAQFRSSSKAAETRPAADYPHRFRQIQGIANRHAFVVPAVSSENRAYFPIGFVGNDTILSNRNYAIYDEPLWNFALLSSALHRVWLSTVCARFELRYAYSNTLGWNAFPLPMLTEKHKADLIRCAEDILLAREARRPSPISTIPTPCPTTCDARMRKTTRRWSAFISAGAFVTTLSGWKSCSTFIRK